MSRIYHVADTSQSQPSSPPASPPLIVDGYEPPDEKDDDHPPKWSSSHSGRVGGRDREWLKRAVERSTQAGGF